MVRLVLIVGCALAGAMALYKLMRFARTREWDWAGFGLAIAFVLLAVWLRMLTGVGGVADG